MNWLFLIFTVVIGAISSFLYFGGLWLTLRKIAEDKRLYWLVPVSFVIRIAFVMLVFYALLINHWAYMAVALISFLITRQILVTRLGKSEGVFD